MMIGRRGFIGAGVLVLSGCGFQPVYMPSGGGQPGVARRELAAINVGIIPDRPGQLLRQALQERFEGADGPSAHPLYDLNVTYWIAGEGIAIQPDTTATRIRFFGNANWVLVARDPARTNVTEGASRVQDAVNIIDQQYFSADLQTEAAYGRIAQAMADQITLRLAVFFRNQARTQHLS